MVTIKIFEDIMYAFFQKPNKLFNQKMQQLPNRQF